MVQQRAVAHWPTAARLAHTHSHSLSREQVRRRCPTSICWLGGCLCGRRRITTTAVCVGRQSQPVSSHAPTRSRLDASRVGREDGHDQTSAALGRRAPPPSIKGSLARKNSILYFAHFHYLTISLPAAHRASDCLFFFLTPAGTLVMVPFALPHSVTIERVFHE